jgi:hypothetical protein
MKFSEFSKYGITVLETGSYENHHDSVINIIYETEDGIFSSEWTKDFLNNFWRTECHKVKSAEKALGLWNLCGLETVDINILVTQETIFWNLENMYGTNHIRGSE